MGIKILRLLVSCILVIPCLVHAQPIADFTATPTSGCAPLVISFQDLSQGNIVSWKWSLGLSNSTLQNPGVFYQTPGDYDIRLIVTDNQGRSDTVVKPQYIHIYDKPSVQFQANSLNVCAFEPVQFTDLSQAGSGMINQWIWDFGNGQTSSQSHPTTLYAQPGAYPVSLIVRNQYGCEEDLILNQYIKVQAPDVSFQGDVLLACGPPLSVNFASLGTTSGTHFWDFGDGTTSNQIHPSHTYLQNGSFDVSHIIEDGKGCRDTLVEAAYINIGVNTLSIYANDSTVCLRDTVFFHTNATTNSQVFWDFADGTTDTTLHPKHRYQQAGTYQVQATISDLSGCTNTLSFPVIVNAYPDVAFTVADTNIGCEVPFQVQFQDLTPNAIQWQWSFGDGSSSTLPHPQHTYTYADSFTVSLRVTGPGGCADSWRKAKYIVVQPVEAGFVMEPRGGCAPLLVSYTDTSHSVFPITRWEWDFGDGGTDTTWHDFHTYQNPGSYSVSLLIENSAGCKDSVTRQGFASAGVKPIIDFGVDTSQACALDEIQFLNYTTGADNYIWFFGDGDTAMSLNPTHGFAALGDVDVMLVASDRGCRDTLYRPDYVNILAPLPIIGLSDKVLCAAPDTVLFQNLTIGDDYWEWNLEDGYTTTDPSFSYPISQEGYFHLSLTVGNYATGCEVTAEDSILVIPVVADFVVDTQRTCTPGMIQFTDSSLNAIEWHWNFGNGDTSLLANPRIWFDTAGVYDITLIVKNAVKCYDTLTQVAYVQGLASEARFATRTPSNGCLPLTVDFEDRSTSTGSIVDWLWDFGDGTTSTQQHPSHVYTQKGYFTVSLTVTDADGCSDTYILDKAIFATLPIADIGVNPPVNCPGLRSTFVSKSNGSGLSYWWDFGDGTGSYLANTTHAYADTGYYDITLMVTDVNGCRDTITKPKQVKIRDLKAAFVADSVYASCPPLSVSFLSDTTYRHPNITWFWDFGDGATGSSPFPTHVYTQPGSYDVTFVISSSTGCRDSVFVPDMIVIDGPKADIQFTPGEGCPGTDFQFTAITSDSVSYRWLFGDGSSDTGLVVNHIYTSPGSYIPVLKIEDRLGCQVFSPADSSIEIFDLPVARFSANNVVFCDSGAVQFVDLSTSASPLAAWWWDFGDGTTSQQQFPSHTYTQPGSFSVQMAVFNANGCSDTIQIDSFVKVFRSPQPGLLFQPGKELCEGTPLTLSPVLNGHPYSITAYDWDLGEPNAQYQSPGVDHTFTRAGRYFLSLTVSDENGCQVLVNDSVLVNPSPIPHFAVSDSMGCAPFPIQFTNLTQGSIQSQLWSFGDGMTSADRDPLHTYLQNGLFSVSLQVTDSNGCSAQLTRNESIALAVPQAAFAVSDTVICPGTELYFADQSSARSPLVSWLWNFGDGNSSLARGPAHTYGQSGTYPVSLTVTDSLGCSHTYTDSTAVEILRDQIPKILPIRAVSVTGSHIVTVSYEAFPNVYGDFGAYVIYRQDANGAFQEVGRVTQVDQTVFVDTQARPEERSECYKIQVENHCGTSYPLELTESHCTISLQTTPLVEEVALDWTAYQGWPEVEQYNIYRVQNYDLTQKELIGSLPGTLTRFVDQDMFCYEQYSYRIEAIARGSRQSFSDTAYAVPVHLAPDEPAHTRRVSVENNAYITVSWDLPMVNNAQQIVVERDNGNGFVELLREDVRQGNVKFNDLQADFNKGTYRYQVSVMDTCGDYTPTGRHGVNIHLTTRQVGNSVLLTWTPYLGWEFGVSGYEVQYYDPATDQFLTLAHLNGTTTKYADETIINQEGQICYRIIGHEWEGLQETSTSNESCTVLAGQIIGASAFSPNGDGHNDGFRLIGVFLESYELVIYNRWGNVVFRANSLQDIWTGRDLEGRPCQEGVYVYIANGIGIDGQKVKRVGSVTLIR